MYINVWVSVKIIIWKEKDIGNLPTIAFTRSFKISVKDFKGASASANFDSADSSWVLNVSSWSSMSVFKDMFSSVA